MSSNIRIGTSGIVVPGKQQDYPEEHKGKSRLQYYSNLYNTVEINSTFHKVPLARTLVKWEGEVHDDFIFTLKLWRGITHNKKLAFQLPDIDLFMGVAEHIQKKGCLLIQFPASINYNYANNVEEILERIKSHKTKWQLCLEVRHSSWYQEHFYEMLNKYSASLVFHDIAASKPPFVSLESDTIYFRYHGPEGNYRGSYSNHFLEQQADYMKEWLKKGKMVYAYFNNTMGSALENSHYLQQLLSLS
ncbi:MAG TPA: DUF72 domain-containing protein [Cytophagaceae bacterium]